MRYLILIFALFFGIQTVISQNILESDSLQIVNKIDDWNRAWKTKDVELACKWYSENADFTNAFGFNRIGQLEIQKYLTEVFGFDFVMAGNTEQTSLKLKKISDKAILAITTVDRKGQKTANNKNLETRKTTHYRLFEKTEQWKITAHLISDARSINTKKH
ncbi:hypothetical protein PW52_12895 [Tamlana sedimentorum]|uniref:DUF4440 domain-containing protein n=1 Tax=Neotamlana sedimentorum TaxID=1435349 RepID=A0A0D7WB57_9FLAO|nr:hypothetical protein [Tamlana sedimentorum]KJD34987.1 hypothetical protein PW52_12895 [Tamlana sedimentorum]